MEQSEFMSLTMLSKKEMETYQQKVCFGMCQKPCMMKTGAYWCCEHYQWYLKKQKIIPE